MLFFGCSGHQRGQRRHDQIGQHQGRQSDQDRPGDVGKGAAGQPGIGRAHEQELDAHHRHDAEQKGAQGGPQRLDPLARFQPDQPGLEFQPRHGTGEIDNGQQPGEGGGKGAATIQRAALQRMHQRPLAGQQEIQRILQRAGSAAINHGRRHQRLIEKAQRDEHDEHRLIEAGDQVMRPEALQPGRTGMAGRGAEAADEQQPHGHEQHRADADGEGGGLQRYAGQKGQADGMGPREEAEHDPAFR